MLRFLIHRATRRTLGLIAIAAVACLGGCSSSVKTWPVVHTASIRSSQIHESVRIAEGQTLTVQLPTEGGTPYIWRLAPESFSNDLIEFQSRREQQTSTGKFASIGEPAVDEFKFFASDAGTTELVFMLDQRMNSDQSQIAKMVLTVDVFDAKAEARAAADAREAAEEAAEAQAIASAESDLQ